MQRTEIVDGGAYLALEVGDASGPGHRRAAGHTVARDQVSAARRAASLMRPRKHPIVVDPVGWSWPACFPGCIG